MAAEAAAERMTAGAAAEPAPPLPPQARQPCAERTQTAPDPTLVSDPGTRGVVGNGTKPAASPEPGRTPAGLETRHASAAPNSTSREPLSTPLLEGCGGQASGCEGCCNKAFSFFHLAGRIFCKKGCGMDGDTVTDCAEGCEGACFKEEVLQGQSWSSIFARAPGDKKSSEMCLRACRQGCLWQAYFEESSKRRPQEET